MTKPFFKDDYATIALDDAIPCIQLTLTGIPRHSEHYQLVQQKRLEFMKKQIRNYPKLHMLTDSRTAGPVLEEDVDYFKNHVLPEMERSGVRYLAIVMPSNKFTQLTIRDMTRDSRVMTVNYFDALADARKWLKKMTRA
jgi:hypothetical protein